MFLIPLTPVYIKSCIFWFSSVHFWILEGSLSLDALRPFWLHLLDRLESPNMSPLISELRLPFLEEDPEMQTLVAQREARKSKAEGKAESYRLRRTMFSMRLMHPFELILAQSKLQEFIWTLIMLGTSNTDMQKLKSLTLDQGWFHQSQVPGRVYGRLGLISEPFAMAAKENDASKSIAKQRDCFRLDGKWIGFQSRKSQVKSNWFRDLRSCISFGAKPTPCIESPHFSTFKSLNAFPSHSACNHELYRMSEARRLGFPSCPRKLMEIGTWKNILIV